MFTALSLLVLYIVMCFGHSYKHLYSFSPTLFMYMNNIIIAFIIQYVCATCLLKQMSVKS